MSLIWSYIWPEDRKCKSDSTSLCRQCAHSLSSLESQVCLQRPFSIARPCILSLYIVEAFLHFGSVTVVLSLSLTLPCSISLSILLFLPTISFVSHPCLSFVRKGMDDVCSRVFCLAQPPDADDRSWPGGTQSQLGDNDAVSRGDCSHRYS